ncbi:cell wall hydrolase [Sphingomonas immobilis]|uniref:cell wall hydrolase n=1 Tax=Sphingomonas immobilis TaxID=3063997 RepID=UPI003D66E9DA
MLIVTAIAAIVVPVLLVRYGPRIAPKRVVVIEKRRVVAATELPPVEPVAFQDLAPDDARTYNSLVPFSDLPNPAARPFQLTGTADQRARAVDCMAAAMLYEAGDDPEGQRAVGQVVINRARHPAFPKTICGVVFQGQERATGCQFTFTCDGALARHQWSAEAWVRARERAVAALTGSVFKPVGYSTHYHTDWVVPYWQASLDKVTAVHTHLFFRWTGWWGTPGAFSRGISDDEPAIAQLAAYSDAHRTAAVLAEAGGIVAGAPTLEPGALAPLAGDPNSFILTLDAHAPPDAFAVFAAKACGDRPYCKVMGWTDKTKTPTALPLQPGQIGSMSFSYLRDTSRKYEKALWNCSEFKRADFAQCMKVQVFMPAGMRTPAETPKPDPAPTPQPAKPGAVAPKPVPDGLAGVRRKPIDVPFTVRPAPPAAKPTPQPTPTPAGR